jgi:3-dehydroquinate synthetase
MVAATKLAVDSGFCAAEVLSRLTRLLEQIGLPTAAADLAPTPALLEAMKLDKKVAGGALRLVLPQRLGMVSVVKDAPLNAVAAAWEAIRKKI